ncbi:zinc finger, CCHC-type, Retrotransposon gag domain protein [Artemisia annua]|uniref:Zinc finger, CCHC-type, Retrotransposon gag domain protein n=1 Tax=Artemisia annua TaxID=35608 RepID=A0A2U1NGF4_ARTAN|nr:zinc finger, CCHC-type, Retrotransposon gag domain protein [Artemisia annua]
MSVNKTPEEIAAFNAAVARAIEALMPKLRARLFEEFRQEAFGSGSGGGGTPVTISGWLEKFGKEKPRSFSSTNTPVDAENWIAHIEKIFEVLDCGDEFKARLAGYKLEGDALKWWKAYKQAKGFLGAKAGTQEEQASHFKWGLKEWILDGIVNTEFTDVAQVANAGRNIELLRERNRENKRNRDGDRIRSSSASRMSVNKTPEEIAAFNAAVAQAIEALMPELRARLFEEFRQEAFGSGSGGGGTPVTISGWLEKFGKEKPRSFSSTNTPVDAENWIAHIEKIFEVLDCGDEFKARLAGYKLEGDALKWWKAYKQAKGDEFVLNMTWADFRNEDSETTNEFMKRFMRLAGFLGAKAGTQEEQASHFKWGLKEWILDGIVNTEFTDVVQVANAGRNIELLRERNRENKRNCDGDRIRSSSASRIRDQRYHESESTTTYEICGKWHPGKPCHEISGACFACGSIDQFI